MKKKVDIKGLDCRSCEIGLEDNLASIEGVESVKVSHRKGQAEIEVSAAVSEEKIRKAIKKSGYEVGQDSREAWINRTPGYYRDFGLALALVFVAYVLIFRSGIFSINFVPEAVSFSVAVIIGLIAGVSTCMVMIGGLVLGFAAKYAQAHPKASTWGKFRPHLAFNIGRIFGYGFFGALLGLIGSAISLSPMFMAVLTILVGIVLVLLALNMTNFSPRLNDLVLALPKSWSRRLGASGSHGKGYTHTGAALGGALTFFLPCGFTQAMQVYAVASGSAWGGFLVMTAFAIGGALPLMGIGGLASVMRGRAGKLFYLAAGLMVLIMGLFDVKVGTMALVGNLNSGHNEVGIMDGDQDDEVQVIRTVQSGIGYEPKVQTVKRGIPVRWIIFSKTEFTCSSAIVIPQLGISRSLKLGENVIEFVPTENVDISFSCASGLYDGVIKVVD